MTRPLPFLAVPPFPRSKPVPAQALGEQRHEIGDGELDAIVAALVEQRVGGTYWAKQPDVGETPYVLIRASGAGAACPSAAGRTLHWSERANGSASGVHGPCDPWHMLSGASELLCDADDPLQLIAALRGVPVKFSDRPAADARLLPAPEWRERLRSALTERPFVDPFLGEVMPWSRAIELCGFWRRLIDGNRPLEGAFGFAAWKRTTTEPLLWNGTGPVPFDRLPTIPDRKVAVWQSRTSASRLTALAKAQARVVEVEDGFIRSAGLGANCVPPQSIILDSLGVHFDASGPSELEQILQHGTFDAALLARAERLRGDIVALGLSKYDVGQVRLERRNRRVHLLVPGQVEDDRAVLAGIGEVLTNHELLRRVRAAAPEAHIIYKPHPDVDAGHRRGGLDDAAACTMADEVVREPSISSWIDLVDEVHVNSSLAGFEALLRHKGVVTYGVPFYAGWGLTQDRGAVPDRRSARRSLDELVAACLILYPRYVDPVTNLPCPVEVLISRMSAPAAPARPRPLVRARQLQGWIRRVITRGGRP